MAKLKFWISTARARTNLYILDQALHFITDRNNITGVVCIASPTRYRFSPSLRFSTPLLAIHSKFTSFYPRFLLLFQPTNPTQFQLPPSSTTCDIRSCLFQQTRFVLLPFRNSSSLFEPTVYKSLKFLQHCIVFRVPLHAFRAQLIHSRAYLSHSFCYHSHSSESFPLTRHCASSKRQWRPLASPPSDPGGRTHALSSTVNHGTRTRRHPIVTLNP